MKVPLSSLTFFLTYRWQSVFLRQVATSCLSREQQVQWLERIGARFTLFVPQAVENHIHWQKFGPPGSLGGTQSPVPALTQIRAAEPVKSFLFKSRETVATFPDPLELASSDKQVLFGVKGCDIAALAVHRKMFLEGEFVDPFYQLRLENTILVAADCPAPADSCFCNLVGGRPYVREGADVVVSEVDGQWLVEPLTPRGQELLALLDDVLPGQADEALVQRRDEIRAAAEAKLAEINPEPLPADLPARLRRRETDAPFYAEHAADCVECSGCLLSCPTCYCFLLYDQLQGRQMERLKVWDACYLAAYQRVGGGANPRGQFLRRFANRFECKFEHFKNSNGFYACSGCGRCFRVCMGKIDIRRVLLSV